VRAAIDATELIGRRADLTLASTDANVPISQEFQRLRSAPVEGA